MKKPCILANKQSKFDTERKPSKTKISTTNPT